MSPRATLHAIGTVRRGVLMHHTSPRLRAGQGAEQAPPSPDYVPGPELADDEIVAGDQPYAEDASPMAHSPDDVPESDPEDRDRRG
ncbi:hypothetical protein Tco_1256292 [Tanacetum coccineum]